MRLRHLVLPVHRWIGLASSLLLGVAGATGMALLLPGAPLLRRIAGPLHENLSLGSVGAWIVIAVTAAAIVLELSGLMLWWGRKRVAVRARLGWRIALVDLHHSFGALGFVLMFVVAVTGFGMAFTTPQEYPVLRPLLADLHTSRDYPAPIKVIYMFASAGFVLQGFTGIVMWLKTRRRRI